MLTWWSGGRNLIWIVENWFIRLTHVFISRWTKPQATNNSLLTAPQAMRMWPVLYLGLHSAVCSPVKTNWLVCYVLETDLVWQRAGTRCARICTWLAKHVRFTMDKAMTCPKLAPNKPTTVERAKLPAKQKSRRCESPRLARALHECSRRYAAHPRLSTGKSLPSASYPSTHTYAVSTTVHLRSTTQQTAYILTDRLFVSS